MQRKRHTKGLGVDLYAEQRTKKDKSILAEARILTALSFVRRAQRLPFDADKRAHMIMAGAIPAGLHGAAVTAFTAKQIAELRKEILIAIFPLWKGQTQPRCADIVFSLLYPGHRLDPQQVVVHECMKLYYRIPGPMGLVAECAEWLGWKWTDACTFQSDEGTALRCLDISEERLLHEVREASRRRLLRLAARDRANDFWGIQNGVDRMATMALSIVRVCSDALAPEKTVDLRDADACKRAGLTAEACKMTATPRYSIRGRSQGEVYPHPAGVVEAVRHAADAGGGGVHPHPPPAAVQGGADEAKGACITRVAVQCAPDGGVHPHPPGGDIRRVKVMHKGAAHWCTEVLVQGHVLWYTDGASSNNQDSRFRRAGYGAICGWARMEHLSGAGGHWRHQGPDEQQGRTTCGGGGAGTRSATGPPRNRQCICARWGQAEPAAMACARVAAAGCVAEANCQCGPVEAPARTAQCTRAIGAMAESERPRH
eukprot:gene19316-biopygen6121